MEKKFYQDNFEQLLRETTDNFRMYPSKRVWHSIYNDLHPSRKWPSLAICLLLISSIAYIGFSNVNQAPPGAGPASKKALIEKNEMFKTVSAQPTTSIKGVTQNNVSNRFADPKSNAPNTTAYLTRPFNDNNITNDKQSSRIKSADIIPGNKATALDILDNSQSQPETQGGLPSPAMASSTNIFPVTNGNIGADENKKDDELKNKPAKSPEKNNIFTDKEWIEDFAFHNKPLASKWRTRVSYQLYATPSVGYRKLSRNSAYNPVASPSLVATPGNVEDFESALSQAPAINMELGGNIFYGISSKVNLKLGVQFNYSNYNINAYELKHPTMTTIALNDLNTGFPILAPRPTTLANIDGAFSKKLNNNSYQISLPLGADIKLAGKNNLKWYAGATIQPTYIAGGNSYLISADLKNYVSDNSMMRTWNLNAGVETFVSYKTKSGIILNAGPQFRYQLLSTLTNEYTYDEKLYNLGLKIGIITRF